ncbi:NAD-dependent epimerase/dehydratase family protein [Nonomuraea typhae]|uniref:NAD-dependent epimerase/dehydratase family protein n=1 Tax=Nonomuraea typhae TaxID=2603600 RepID=UPI0012FC1C7A|nr:NAD(P)-dependent oxidoreductase [Nonomuraea typhae]
MTRTLVTGSAGRLGRSVVTALAAAGHEVIGIDRAPGTPPQAAATMPADLTDLGEAFEVMTRFRPDSVVHLAAIAVPFSRSDAVTFRVNTQLAFNVCESAVRSGVERVVVASSPTVIGYGTPGWTPSYLPIDEDHPLAPWNAYGLSKQVAEEVVRSYARTAGTRLAVFRPCYVVAPEEWEGAPTQQGHTMAERLDRPELAGVSLFNYIDARDAAAFVQALLDGLPRIPNGEVFFAGAADALTREPLSEVLPKVVPSTSGLADSLGDVVFSCKKAERLLGWRAARSWRTELRA